MNKYETVIIMNSEITEEQRKNVFNTITEYITDNGKITKIDDLGVKRLAYEVKKHLEGYYYVIKFECEASAIPELERTYRITDEVIKFIVIRDDN